MNNGIVIPALWCPLELRVREGEERFQAGSHLWLERHGLDERSLLRATATDTGFLACAWAPDGTDEGVQLLSDWLIWALLFDDYYCDTGPHSARPGTFNPLAARMMARALVPETGLTGETDFDAFASALSDLVRRIHIQADPALAYLCVIAHYRWAVGTMCGVSDRAAGMVRSMEDHLLVRPLDGANALSELMIEVAEGSVLPSYERIRPEVRALSQAAGILLTVPTDLASYVREAHQESLESNLVHILAVQHGVSAQEATEQSCALLETVMEFFLAMSHQLRKDAAPHLIRYTDQLSNMVRGTYEWQRSLPRYTTVLDVPENAGAAPLARPTTALHAIAQEKSRTHVGRPGPIAWWWDLLRNRS